MAQEATHFNLLMLLQFLQSDLYNTNHLYTIRYLEFSDV